MSAIKHISSKNQFYNYGQLDNAFTNGIAQIQKIHCYYGIDHNWELEEGRERRVGRVEGMDGQTDKSSQVHASTTGV